MKRKGYAVDKMLKEIRLSKSHKGDTLSLTNEDEGIVGMIPVFESEAAAKRVFGKDVPLQPVELG